MNFFRQDSRKLERDVNNQAIAFKIFEKMDAEVQNLMRLHENMQKILNELDRKLEAFKVVDEKVIQMRRLILQLQTQNEAEMQQLKKNEGVDQRYQNSLKQKKAGLRE